MTPLTDLILVGLGFCFLGLCLLPLIIPSTPAQRREIGIRLPEDDQ